MRQISWTILTLILVCCSSKQEPKSPNLKLDSVEAINSVDFAIIGDSLQLPSFQIQIDLDEKAEQKIIDQKETIIIQADIFGTPKDSVDAELLTELGELYLATPRIEIDKPGIARFDKIRISRKSYDALSDRDFLVLINVFSGRKSSADNLLHCEILQKPISEVVGKTHTLKGKLISE